MQNGINHAGCSSITRNIERAQKRIQDQGKTGLDNQGESSSKREDQQKLVMTKVNASSVVIQLARKDSMKLLLFNWIKT